MRRLACAPFGQMQTMKRVRQDRIVRGQQDEAMGFGGKRLGQGAAALGVARRG